MSSAASRYESPRALAKWVTAALVFCVAADIYIVMISLEGLEITRALQGGGDISGERLLAFALRLDNITLVVFGTLIPAVIAFCLWTHRVATNAAAWGAQSHMTPGWAVGYYFIPILNLWKPYEGIANVWRGSDPARRDDDAPFHSMVGPVPWFFLAWWLTWIASRIPERVATSIFNDAGLDLAAMEGGFKWLLYGVAMELIAAVLCIVVVWKLTWRQEARGEIPTARVVEAS